MSDLASPAIKKHRNLPDCRKWGTINSYFLCFFLGFECLPLILHLAGHDPSTFLLPQHLLLYFTSLFLHLVPSSSSLSIHYPLFSCFLHILLPSSLFSIARIFFLYSTHKYIYISGN